MKRTTAPAVAAALLFGGCALFSSFDEQFSLHDDAEPGAGSGGDAGTGGATGAGDGGGPSTGPGSGGGGSASSSTGQGGRGGGGGGGGGGEQNCMDTCVSGNCDDVGCLPWVQTFGSSTMEGVRFIASGSDGSVVVAGDFDSQLTIGGDVLTSYGEMDMFVAKFSRHGQPLWARSAGGTLWDGASGVAVDDGDNVYVALVCADATFSPLGHRGQNGENDVCVAKYSPAGQLLWARGFGSTMWDSSAGISVDDNGVYIAGEFNTSITFGPTVLGSYTHGGFVAKLDRSTGQPVWARSYVSSMASMSAIHANAGSLYLAGTCNGSMDFGTTMIGDGDSVPNMFVAKVTADSGEEVWVRAMANTDLDIGWGQINGIAADGDNVSVAAMFNGKWDFGGGTVNMQYTSGLLLRLGNQGVHQWEHYLTSDSMAELIGVSAGPAGSVVFTGVYNGFNSAFATQSLSNPGSFTYQGVVGRVNSVGGVESLMPFGGTGNEYPSAPHVHKQNFNTLYAGSFEDTVNFGTGDVMANGADAFVVSHGEF